MEVSVLRMRQVKVLTAHTSAASKNNYASCSVAIDTWWVHAPQGIFLSFLFRVNNATFQACGMGRKQGDGENELKRSKCDSNNPTRSLLEDPK